MTQHQQKEIFEEWLGKHKALIFKIVRSYAFTSPDKDDLFQEIIIQVWRSIPTFRHACAVTTWLYRISLNTSISWSKKERRNQHDASLESIEHVLQENVVSVDDRLAWLYDEIAQLDEIDRSVALLMLDGFSYKEMAEILGITESNVGVKINRIKKKLIGRSKKYEYDGI